MSKTSQLSALTTGSNGLAQDDLIQVVDVSDKTTMLGGDGTNKKITLTNFASGLIAVGGVQPLIQSGLSNQYYAGDKNWKTLNKAAVELSNVTNESKEVMFTNPTFTGIASLPADTSIGNVTSAELGRLDGVSSNIQTQLDDKQPMIDGAASTIVTNDLDPNVVVISDSSGKVESSTITATELSYLDGVSSNIQSQLNAIKYTVVPLSASTLTLGLTHINKYIQCSNTTKSDITVPRQLTVAWPEESVIYFRRQTGAGEIYLIPDISVTINGGFFAPTVLENQNFALKRVAQNVWDFI